MKILHLLRTPVGGLFRHVCDLAATQAERGYEVGVVYDSSTGDALTAGRLSTLARSCALGIHGIPMSRALSHRDLTGFLAVRRIARATGSKVLHGHGAKGGALARLVAATDGNTRAFYTPHGGSLHFDRGSVSGALFLGLERLLDARTDGLIFESAFSARAYAAKVGSPTALTRIIPNGLQPPEFEPAMPNADASDFLFIGELRHLKGVDVLLRALAQCGSATATIVGAGPDAAGFKALAGELALTERVRFVGAKPAREAFALGRILVVPSRAESFPYIVLEGAAASLPLIATDVGGIPEILDGSGTPMIPADDVAALLAAMRTALTDGHKSSTSMALRAHVAARFTIERMTDAVLAFYAEAPAPSPALQASHSGAR